MLATVIGVGNAVPSNGAKIATYLDAFHFQNDSVCPSRIGLFSCTWAAHVFCSKVSRLQVLFCFKCWLFNRRPHRPRSLQAGPEVYPSNFQNTHLLVLRLSRCVSSLEVETDIVSTDATGSVSWLCRANLGEDDHDLLVGYVDYLYPKV